MSERADEDREQPEEEHPLGTLVILLIYLVIIFGLWGSVYLTLLQRRG